jgi:tetratricopeptide (TPR) repeat protein
MTVNLPVVLLILDVYPLRRLGGSIGWWGEAARRVCLEKIPFALLALAASAFAFLGLFQVGNLAPLDRLSLLDRLAISAYGLSFYLWKMILPLNLSPLYELRPVSPLGTRFLLSYAGVLTLTAIALALRRRLPGLLAVWLAYVVILLPVLGIFQNGPQIAADRYTYLAGLGWAMLAGAGLLSSWHVTRRLLLGCSLCVLVALGAHTWNQAQVWHDSERLWSHAVAIDPNSSLALNNRGMALGQQGELANAIEHFEQALRIDPNHAEAHNNLGAALVRSAKSAEAIEHLRQASRLEPDFAEAHFNWGLALAQLGKPDEAIKHYRKALQIGPGDAEALNNWGLALAQQGKLVEAIERYREALQIRPDDAATHKNWGLALAQLGKPDEAIEHYRRALALRPDFAEAHVAWGEALARQGRVAEAIEHFRFRPTGSPRTRDISP